MADRNSRSNVSVSTVHRIGFGVFAAVLLFGVLTVLLSGFMWRSRREVSAEEAAIRLARSWKPVDLKPTDAPWERARLNRTVSRVERYAEKYGPLQSVKNFHLLSDNLDVDPNAPPPMYKNEAKWLNGTILASLEGRFAHGKALFIMGMRKTNWGMEVVAVSPNLLRKAQMN